MNDNNDLEITDFLDSEENEAMLGMSSPAVDNFEEDENTFEMPSLDDMMISEDDFKSTPVENEFYTAYDDNFDKGFTDDYLPDNESRYNPNHDVEFSMDEVYLPEDVQEIQAQESFEQNSSFYDDTAMPFDEEAFAHQQVVNPEPSVQNPQFNNFSHLEDFDEDDDIDAINDDVDDIEEREDRGNSFSDFESMLEGMNAHEKELEELDAQDLIDDPPEIDRSYKKNSKFDSQYVDEDDEEEMREALRFNIEDVLSAAVDRKVEDVHINVGDQVGFTINGDIERVPQFGFVSENQVGFAYERITNHKLRETFAKEFELDASYELKTGINKGRRFRVNIAKSFEQFSITARLGNESVLSPREMGVDSRIVRAANLSNGLALICGPTSSGKTTTFNSVFEEVNERKPKKIITIEKPIEYVYKKKRALIVQREVGRDTKSFANGLKSAMRQAPDVILVGEVRDKEEFDELLRASESGHLAMSTMHTNSPPATISRIKSLYSGDEQLRILGTLRQNLRLIANQVLVKRKDGTGRICIQVVLQANREVSAMIGEGDDEGIENYMIAREETFEHKFVERILDGTISYEEAVNHSVQPIYLDELLEERGYKFPE